MRDLGWKCARWILAAALLVTLELRSAAQDAPVPGANLKASANDTTPLSPSAFGVSSGAANSFATGSDSLTPQAILLPSLAQPDPGRASSPGAAPMPAMDNSYQRWEVEAGAVFTRFRSSIFYASMFGFRSGVAYHLNDWITAEGGITTGFAPAIFGDDLVKYLDYMGGVRFGPRRDRFSPWIHAELGGAHMLPQLAGLGTNAFAYKAGVGLEYKPFYSVSLRAQADWLRTQFYGESQDNVQASVGLVFHF